MKEYNVHIALKEDKSHLFMTTIIDGVPQVRTAWSAPDVESYIAALANARGDMSDQVSNVPARSSLEPTPQDPAFKIAKADDRQSYKLSMRHPGLGWVDWEISSEHLMRMMSEMLAVMKAA